MGIASSREVLCKPPESQEGRGHSKRNIAAFFANHRLVRDKLCQEVQCCIHNQQEHVRDSIPLVQEPSQGLQQEDVRPVLPVQADKIQGVGHDCGSAKLFRVGSLGRDYSVSGDQS